MKKLLPLITLLLITFSARAQCDLGINHWEAISKDGAIWKYQAPAQNSPGWYLPAFNDASWASGASGIGFGDNDDATIVPTSADVVYMRRTFNVIDKTVIASVVFSMDFDDGFVAYLNGVEIGRTGIDGTPTFNTTASGNNEAMLYQGQNPGFSLTLPTAAIDTLLLQGNNVLAVEIHNVNSTSSDLTSRPFLHVGISNTSFNYQTVAPWFIPPSALQTYLPIVKINTNGQSINDDPRITAQMQIIHNNLGNMNCILDAPNEYNGNITIEYRGSSSQGFPKKPYGLTTVDMSGNDSDVSILGFPAEHDWIFSAPYTDKPFMRDVITYNMANILGWYASKTQFVELYINDQYWGVHILMEKIKRDDGRVNIGKLTPTANSGDSLTGGYVFKIDKVTGNSGPGFNTTIQDVPIQFHDPKWDDITTAQKNYLNNYVNTFEAALFSNNFTDPNLGYRKYANIFSFVDLILMNELSVNIDGYRLSTYMHKDRDSKCGRLTMGPFWDYNLGYGNANYCSSTQGWQINSGCAAEANTWFDKILQDPYFANMTRCRWDELRNSTFSNDSIMARIDAYASYLTEPSKRDSARWQTIGNYIWPNNWIAPTWQGEVDSMKQFIVQRLNWMDANMVGSNANCNTLSTATLVVDEVNFHSADNADAGDWIELWNYGAAPIDISNFMVMDTKSRELYCVIENNTILQPNARLVLYQDSTLFTTQFPNVSNKARLCFKLSNGGQNIMLRDANNLLINSFTYDDGWYAITDGGGYTLQRSAPSSNGNASSDWFVSCLGGSPGVPYTDCTTGITSVDNSNLMKIYPNPTADKFTISIPNLVESVKIFDMTGRCVLSTQHTAISVATLAQGLYNITVVDNKGHTYHSQISKR